MKVSTKKRPSRRDDDEPTHNPPREARRTFAVFRLNDGSWSEVDRRLIPEDQRERDSPRGWPAAWEPLAERGAFGRYSAESRHDARFDGDGQNSRPGLEAFLLASRGRGEKQRDIEDVKELLRSIPLVRSLLAGKERPRPGQPRPAKLGTTGVMLMEIVRALIAALMGSEHAGRSRSGARVGGEKERHAFGSTVAVLEASCEAPLIGIAAGTSFDVAQNKRRTSALWHYTPSGGPEIYCKQSSNGASAPRGIVAVERAVTAQAAIQRSGVDAVDLAGLVAWKVHKLPVDERMLRFRVAVLRGRGVEPEAIVPAPTAAALRAQLHTLRRELADSEGINALILRPGKTLEAAGALEADRARREDMARPTDTIITTDGAPVADPEVRPSLFRRTIGELVREVMGNPFHWAWPDRLSQDDRLLIIERRGAAGGKAEPLYSDERLAAMRKAVTDLEGQVHRAELDDERAARAAVLKATEELTHEAIAARLKRAQRHLEASFLAPPENAGDEGRGLIPTPDRREKRAAPLGSSVPAFRPRRLGDVAA